MNTNENNSTMANTRPGAAVTFDEPLVEKMSCKFRSTGGVDRYECELRMFRTPVKSAAPMTPPKTVSHAPIYKTPTTTKQPPFQTPLRTAPSNRPAATEPLKRVRIATETPLRCAPPCRRILWTDKKGEIKYARGGQTPKKTPKSKNSTLNSRMTPKEASRSAAAASVGAVAGLVALGPVGLAIGSGIVATGAVGYLRQRRLREKKQSLKVQQLVGHAPPCQNPPSRSFPVVVAEEDAL